MGWAWLILHGLLKLVFVALALLLMLLIYRPLKKVFKKEWLRLSIAFLIGMMAYVVINECFVAL